MAKGPRQGKAKINKLQVIDCDLSLRTSCIPPWASGGRHSLDPSKLASTPVGRNLIRTIHHQFVIRLGALRKS